MKAYLLTTGSVFGLLTVVHVWRMVVESSVTHDPWFWLVTLISAALCVWSIRLVRASGYRVA